MDWGTYQTIMCWLCEYEDQYSVYRTHMGKRNQARWSQPSVPVLGKKRQMGPWHLLVSQPGLLGEFQASEKAHVKEIMKKIFEKDGSCLRNCIRHCSLITVCTHTHHKHISVEVGGEENEGVLPYVPGIWGRTEMELSEEYQDLGRVSRGLRRRCRAGILRDIAQPALCLFSAK